MEGKTRVYFLVAALLLFTQPAHAALIELSGLFSYGRSRLTDGYSSDQWRYSGSIDFRFTPVSSIQFEYMSSTTKVQYPVNVGVIIPQNTTEVNRYDDRVYSFNWVQNLVPSKWLVQPYLKAGGGKLHRVQTIEYPQYGLKQSVTSDVVTGVGGLGIRIFLTRSMAIKGEIVSYVPDFRFRLWKENQMFSAGVSWLF